jgi:soluble lytic murein transglycosylase-like protein
MTASPVSSLLAIIVAIFTAPPTHDLKPSISPKPHASQMAVKVAVRKLAGPYAHLVIVAAHKAHVPPRLVAAVVQVENGGDFHGSTTRVSSAGAIGVMQLEPNTAWNTLRVNPWNARQNIDGGARYLATMLHQFHGNVHLALMAYNAGPTTIANGWRPLAAVAYAQAVIRDAAGGPSDA